MYFHPSDAASGSPTSLPNWCRRRARRKTRLTCLLARERKPTNYVSSDNMRIIDSQLPGNNKVPLVLTIRGDLMESQHFHNCLMVMRSPPNCGVRGDHIGSQNANPHPRVLRVPPSHMGTKGNLDLNLYVAVTKWH